jgi:hypothetical protein
MVHLLKSVGLSITEQACMAEIRLCQVYNISMLQTFDHEQNTLVDTRVSLIG